MEASGRREQLRATFAEDAQLYDRMRPSYPSASTILRIMLSSARVLASWRSAAVPARRRGHWPSAATRSRRSTWAQTWWPSLDATCHLRERGVCGFQFRVMAAAGGAIRCCTVSNRLSPAGPDRPGSEDGRGTASWRSTGGDQHAPRRRGRHGVFDEVQACYERWDASTPSGLRLSAADDIPVDTAELDSSGLFEPAVVRSYAWRQAYTASEYRNLLLTYSGHRALDPTNQRHLLDCITDLIQARFSGRITKQYMNQLCLARRRA